MRFTVIGSGAIGGTVGAHLVRAGHDVTFCDADAAHVEAINARGLQVTGPVEQFTAHAPAVLPTDLPTQLGTVLISTKSHHTASAAELLRGRGDDFDVVVSLQNGLTADRLTDVIGPGRLVVSFVNFGADVMEPGVVMQGNVGTFCIGEPDGPVSDRVRELAAALPYAEATDRILGYLWAKEAYGAMLFGTAVSDLSIADALAAPRYRDLWLAVAREVLDQAPVEPLPFDGFDPADLDGSIERLVVFNRGSAKSHSGVYRDLAVRHRKTEVDDLTEAVTGPLTAHIAAVIHAIEDGERRCEVANLDLLAAYERLERLGRPLRAVVDVVPALHRAADGPLLGTPVAVKDMIDVEGLVRGDGNPAGMRRPAATADAPAVARLRAAAADVFATTTLLEYAAGAPHPDLPEALNPVSPGRTAGGSSGGSAALVGAGVCAVALGTDTGGSIRLPAHYCGVVGVKPSHGLLPLEGITPLAPSLDTLGVLAATVADAARALAVLADDPALATAPAPDAPAPRFGTLAAQFDDARLEPEVAAVTRAAVERLAAAGATVTTADATALTAIGALLEPILLPEAWEVHGERVRAEPAHYGAATLRLLQAAEHASAEDRSAALRRRDELLPEVDALFTAVDVLVGPAAPYPAPELTPPIDTPEGEVEGIFSGPYNVSGQPAAVLPVGHTPDGRAVGLQFATRRGDDAGLLAALAWAESALATT